MNKILRIGTFECFVRRSAIFIKDIFLRDCTANNIMLDPSGMYPDGFHPIKINRSKDFKGTAARYDRTQRPPRYYLIDFGLSRQYSSRNVLDKPLRGGDKSAPEHRHGRLCNPFHTDIYYLGNLIRERFIMVLFLDFDLIA
jgi:serine/threonine protein kinase